MDAQKLKHHRQQRRRQHVRNKIVGTASKPRLTVFRSSKHIYAQLIDDINGVTLAAASSASKSSAYGGNVKAAELVGQRLADAAKAKGIGEAAFDRGHFRFHGRLQALAVAATKAGLKCCVPENIKVKKKEEAAPKPEKGEKKPKGEKSDKPKGEKSTDKVKGERPKTEAKA
jgi:large subunit ribosomal protein L18